MYSTSSAESAASAESLTCLLTSLVRLQILPERICPNENVAIVDKATELNVEYLAHEFSVIL